MTYDDNYKKLFPASWYDTVPTDYWSKPEKGWPLPLGLTLGLIAVTIGQAFTITYFYLRRTGYLGSVVAIQKEGAVQYDFSEGVATHLFQPEGFIMLGGYLIGTWMFRVMPSTYYSHSGGINWCHVLAQLLITDLTQYCAHLLEHRVNSAFYRLSHKPHHRFTNPRMFDAYNGSSADTFCMILIPLAVTARLVPANVWSYMTFGTLYANWLTLIHAEYPHPWDPAFKALGMGTPADHHVHHKLFKFNFGHTFM